MNKSLSFGLVGYKFMGKAHSNALARLPMFFPGEYDIVRQAICGRDAEGVAAAARQFGWNSYETDWQKLVSRKDIDAIDITAPSDAHKMIALGAAAEGKHIFCEKPLALTLADAREMLEAVTKNKLKAQIGFNYRFAPAILQARRMIAEGKLGQIFHFRGFYLQDWIIDPDFPLVWRLDKSVCGSGSLGDLGAHVIDLARFLVGDFDRVTGLSRTFVKERPLPSAMTGLSGKAADTSKKAKVEVDDATVFLAEFKNGALGSIEATRFAQGNKNALSFEINGSKGSIRFELERINELQWYDAANPQDKSGFTTIQCTEAVHPYMQAWWPVGHVIGYEHTFVHEMHEFAEAIINDKETSPGFADGVKVSQILEAVERSIERRQWVDVDSL